MSKTLKVLFVNPSENQFKVRRTRISPRNLRKNRNLLSRHTSKSKGNLKTFSKNTVSKETGISENSSDLKVKASSFETIEAIELSGEINSCDDDDESFILALNQLKFPENMKSKIEPSNFLVKRRVNLKIRLDKKVFKKGGKKTEETESILL